MTLRSAVNLRHAAPPRSGYVGVGTPTRIDSGIEGAQLVAGACYQCPDGSETIFLRADTLLYARNSLHGVTPIGECGTVVSIISVGGGVIALRRNAPPLWLKCGSDCTSWCVSPLWNDVSPVAVVRRDMGAESVATQPVALSHGYDSRNHNLTATDVTALGSALRRAYVTMADSAAAAHRFVQPVVARCELVGYDGTVLYTTPPVLVAPASGVQCATSSFIIPAGALVAPSVTLSATSFAVEAVRCVADDDIFDSLVASVRVLVSPQLHPLAAGGVSVWNYGGTDGSALRFDVSLPGHNPLLPPGSPGSVSHGRIMSALGSDKSQLRPWPLPLRGVEADLAEWSRLEKGVSGGEWSLLDEISAPHRFIASCGASNGDALLYADITPIPFSGYSPAECAITATATLPDKPGHPSAAAVTMADGSTVVRSLTCTGFEPGFLSPLLVYPSPRAVTMLIVAPGGRLQVSLSASSCGRWAYWLSPDLAPISLPPSPTGYSVPEASVSYESRHESVALARADKPGEPLAVSRTESGHISAVAAAPRAGVALGFSKASFYVMGAGGITGVSVVGGASFSLASSLLDGRPVSSSSVVAAIPGGVAVVAGGELLRLNGSRVATMLTACKAVSIGWSPSYRELWLTSGLEYNPSTGTIMRSVTVLEPDSLTLFTRTDVTPDAYATGLGTLYICESDGTLRSCSSEADHIHTVSFECEYPIPDSLGWQQAEFRLPLFGRGLKGTVTAAVSQSNLPSEFRTAATIDISGDLIHPLVASVALPHCHSLMIRAELKTQQPSLLRYEP